MTEDAMPVTIEKARLNVWNVGTAFIGIMITAFGWGVIYNKMETNDTRAVEQLRMLSTEISDIREQLPVIVQLQNKTERLSELSVEARGEIKAANERIDRVVESFGGKLDIMITNVNKIATRIEVLSSRMGEITTQRSSFTTTKEN